MSSQEHAAPMRLKRTREALRPGLTQKEALAALAELEKAEAVIAAAQFIVKDNWIPAGSLFSDLASALAAFGSGEGDTT